MNALTLLLILGLTGLMTACNAVARPLQSAAAGWQQQFKANRTAALVNRQSSG